MSEATLLRTLTLKSIIGFGRYKDVSVQQMLDLHSKRPLRSMYFMCSKINFTPEILDLIGIKGKYIIKKPGKNPELHKKLNAEMEKKMGGLAKLKMRNKSKAWRKSSYARSMQYNNDTKGRMKAFNQGNYKDLLR